MHFISNPIKRKKIFLVFYTRKVVSFCEKDHAYAKSKLRSVNLKWLLRLGIYILA